MAKNLNDTQNKNWQRVENCDRYCMAAARVEEKKLLEELADGCFLRLSEKHLNRALNARTRQLRRIVEKRQAQTISKCVDRKCDRRFVSLKKTAVSSCMDTFYLMRHAS